jgi:hypothetical protein
MLVLMIGAVGSAMCFVHMRSTAYGGDPFPKLRIVCPARSCGPVIWPHSTGSVEAGPGRRTRTHLVRELGESLG